MIRFNDDEVCGLLRAVTWYRDMITGSDEIWDRYDYLISKLQKYGEDITDEQGLICRVDK